MVLDLKSLALVLSSLVSHRVVLILEGVMDNEIGENKKDENIKRKTERGEGM